MLKEPYKVSILVPVYGVEQYIERCAVSLFEQTYQNIEYIFVDDCSPDKSIEILRRVVDVYPERKIHVQIVKHESNRGLAAARNTAVENCRTEFLIHVDGDDWVDKTLVEDCVKSQMASGADIVTADYKIIRKEKITTYVDTDLENTKTMMEKLLYGNEVSSRIWGRLIRTSLYKNNGISIKEGANFAEDIAGMIQLLFFAKRHCHLNLPLYNYECSNSSSYTNSFSEKSSRQSLQNNDSIRTFFDVHAPKYLKAIKVQELAKVAGHMMLCSKNRNNKAYYNQELLKRLDKIDKGYWKKLPMKSQIALHLRNYELVRIYTKIGGLVKHFFDK